MHYDPFACCTMTADGKHALECPTLDNERPTLTDLPRQGDRLVVTLIMRAVILEGNEEETKQDLESLKEILQELIPMQDGNTVNVEYAVTRLES